MLRGPMDFNTDVCTDDLIVERTQAAREPIMYRKIQYPSTAVGADRQEEGKALTMHVTVNYLLLFLFFAPPLEVAFLRAACLGNSLICWNNSFLDVNLSSQVAHLNLLSSCSVEIAAAAAAFFARFCAALPFFGACEEGVVSDP